VDKTLIILKPHAVARNLAGRILTRFEDAGLAITELKMLRGSTELWKQFYPNDEAWFRSVGTKTLTSCREIGIDVQSEIGTTDPLAIGKQVKEWLVGHMSSGPCIAAILEGNEAPRKVRKICGATLPNIADPGTIRFDFSCDSPALANREKRPVFNLIHASDPDEENSFAREIALVFDPSEK
jgi:nucleoside-diphosphate kinase